MTSKTPATPPAPQHPQEPGSQQPQRPDEPEHQGVDPTLDTHALEPTGPVTPSPHLLSHAHQRFCQEYIVDLSATRAYMRVYPDAAVTTAGSNGYDLLKKAQIQAEVQRLMDERATVTGITADRVLTRLWMIATADPRELTGYRIGACRHCWGEYHQYQYTEAEFERAESEWVHKEAKRRKAEKDDFVPQHMPRKGGTGFNPKRAPNPECPECFGEGKGREYISDTDRLSEAGSLLFKGMKVTQHGTSVETQNPLEALQLVGRHLGLWNDKLPGPKLDVDPLQALLEQIQGASGTGGALAVVADDPELRERQDVQDVQDVQAKSPASKPGKSTNPAPGAATKRTTWRRA